jgi:hypothetical protein
MQKLNSNRKYASRKQALMRTATPTLMRVALRRSGRRIDTRLMMIWRRNWTWMAQVVTRLVRMRSRLCGGRKYILRRTQSCCQLACSVIEKATSLVSEGEAV